MESIFGRIGVGRLSTPQGLAVTDVAGTSALTWDVGSEWRIRDRREVALGAVSDFLLLAEAPTDQIVLSLAKTYGPLLLCEHGKPYLHGSKPLDVRIPPHLAAARMRGLEKLGSGDGVPPCAPVGVEPLDAWHRWARRVKRVATACQELPGMPAGDEGERILERGPFSALFQDHFAPDAEAVLNRRRRRVLGILEEWMRISGLRVSTHWGSAGLNIHLEGQGALGAVVQDLFFTHSRPPGSYATCSGCRIVFSVDSRRRRPAGKRHWCGSDACVRLKNRDEQRRARSRRKPS